MKMTGILSKAAQQLAYRCIGMILACGSMGFTARAQFTPSETIVGDPASGCLGLEFSPDMKYLVWTQQGTQRSWLCEMNPDTGNMVPTNGQGFAINGIVPSGNPQWGRDSTGWFIIAIDNTGRIVQVRPGSPLSATTITYPAVPINSTRQYPFPARLPNRAASYVLYEQLANGNGAAGIYWVDLADPTNERLVTSPSDGTMPTTLQSLAVTIYRWFPGLPVFTFAYLRGGLAQMAQLDVSQSTPAPLAISHDAQSHIDDFPCVNFGRRELVGGVNSTSTARYYKQDPTTFQQSAIVQITPTGSALTNPQWATSFEPFEWNGRVYSAFQIIDGTSPINPTPAEIWLTSLSDCLHVTDTSLMRRINGTATLERRDPEYFFGTTNTWIFYYAKVTTNTLFTIYRAETGLPNRQIAATLGVTVQGFQSNATQLQMSATSGQYGVLQSSEDLTTWTDRTTTLFGSTAVPYSDAGAGSLPRRFYRMRTP